MSQIYYLYVHGSGIRYDIYVDLNLLVRTCVCNVHKRNMTREEKHAGGKTAHAQIENYPFVLEYGILEKVTAEWEWHSVWRAEWEWHVVWRAEWEWHRAWRVDVNRDTE